MNRTIEKIKRLDIKFDWDLLKGFHFSEKSKYLGYFILEDGKKETKKIEK
ncbi:hypothetical protein [Oceanivirga salmonicida]|nr:hypothetical protein [Oceanivirga salmonicida]